MPAGSAASLPLPQVPLSPYPLARHGQGFAVVPQIAGATAPPRRFPLQKAADDPPRGRVLLAIGNAATALHLQRLLRNAGYRVVGPAGSAPEAERLLGLATSQGRSIDCALIDVGLPGAEALVARLSALVIWLAPAGGLGIPPVDGHVRVLHVPCGREPLLDAIEDAVGRAGRASYPKPPPQPVWPRVFPQL